jgi:hypothetical protein
MKMNKKVSIEELRQRKRETLENIRNLEKRIGEAGKQSMEPLKSSINLSDTIINSLNRGLALYRGIRLGYKMIKMLDHRRNK